MAHLMGECNAEFLVAGAVSALQLLLRLLRASLVLTHALYRAGRLRGPAQKMYFKCRL
jgi:hypothetical protein